MQSVPKVCIVSAVYLETRLRALLEALAVHTRLTLISPETYQFPYGRLKAEFTGSEPYGVRLYPCRFPLGVQTSTRWVLSSRDLDFRALRPDIVHVENEVHSFAVIQALCSGMTIVPRPRLVVSYWGNRWPPQPKAAILKGLVRTIRSKVDLFISANAAGRALLEREGIDSQRVEVFPSTAVDTSYYRPLDPGLRLVHRSKLTLPADAFIVGYSGRFVREKGLVELLDAANLVRSRVSRDVLVLCVGDGPLKLMLENRAGVRVVSPGADGGVLPYYQSMDVLVLASKTTAHWEEQFGRSLVEAMSCGIPPIGSRSGAIPEVIGEAGMLVDEGSSAQLSRSLETLIVEGDLREELGRAAVERVRREYSVDAIAGRTLLAYAKVLAESR